MSEKMTIVIRKRSWIEWTSWAVWLIGALLIIQNAIGSAQELEPRSAPDPLGGHGSLAPGRTE